jgi:16S rRNA (cytosine967-C5)-methyltransferase
MTDKDPRGIATAVLLRVADGDSANAALDTALAGSGLDPRDRALVTALVDGTLRWQGRLDYLLARVLARPLDEVALPIRVILRLAAYQLTQLERVPDHAIVNDAVALARRYGHEGTAKLANAVLRRLAREWPTIPLPDPAVDPVAYLATAYSHPAWLVARWLPRFGFAETEALLLTNNTPPPLTLRVNRRWITRDGLRDMLAMHGVPTEPTPISAWGLIVAGGNPRELEEYREGLFSIQGEGSMVMVELLRPGRHRAGWDLAAGVGGKTTYLAEWVDDTGSLLATDTSAERLAVLAREQARLELQSITVRAADARDAGVAPDSMDYALLDAPCSGTGSLRRQADARWRKTPEGITELTTLQGALLEAAARAVKPGGILLYCTCSLEPEENEDVVNAFLADHPDWQRDPAGIKHKTLHVDAFDADGDVRLLPQRENTDGFYAARLVRG